MADKYRQEHSDADDDEAQWLHPSRELFSDSTSNTPNASPWRAPGILRQSRDVRVKGLLRAARGRGCLGIIDYKVLYWVLAHIGLPLLVFYIDGGVRQTFTAALGLPAYPAGHLNATAVAGSPVRPDAPSPASACSEVLWCSERLQVAAFAVLLVASLALFANLYASDPGWIHPGAPAVDVDPHRPPCVMCGEVPSLRSHHDKHTGQCVHKHDHHCWFLSATIGDLNHDRFLLLLAVEMVLLVWLQLRLLPAAMRCGALWWLGGLLVRQGLGHLAAPCPQAPGLARLWLLWSVVVFGATWLALVGHLLLLHLYLAATNQTTLELLKGPRLTFLARQYATLPASHLAPGGRPPHFLDSRGHVSLLRILHQHLQGTTPPRPFDEGIWRNLWIFFLAPKPYPYRYRSVANDPGS